MEEMNKQQQIFLSEYCPQEINSRKIYPHISTFSSKRNKINVPKFEKMQIHFQGSHSLEFLKKSWNLPSNFPELVKVW